MLDFGTYNRSSNSLLVGDAPKRRPCAGSAEAGPTTRTSRNVNRLACWLDDRGAGVTGAARR